MQQNNTNEATIINEAANDATNDENMLDAVIAGAEQVLQLPKYPVLNGQVLEMLEGKRKAWEEGVYRKSNLELYGILAQCLAYSKPLNDTDAAKKRNAELEAFCKQRKYPIGNDTPTATKVVRAIFGNVDRRRVSTYSLVVRAAMVAKIVPEKMVEWIDGQGGIEEIRLGGSNNGLTDREKVEKIKQFFETQPALGSVRSQEVNDRKWDSDLVGKPCLLYATCESDGSYLIHEIVTADSAINAAMLSLFAKKKEAGLVDNTKATVPVTEDLIAA